MRLVCIFSFCAGLVPRSCGVRLTSPAAAEHNVTDVKKNGQGGNATLPHTGSYGIKQEAVSQGRLSAEEGRQEIQDQAAEISCPGQPGVEVPNYSIEHIYISLLYTLHLQWVCGIVNNYVVSDAFLQ